ncbi:MAG: DUF2388 domain-containing protein [Pseudomonas sp.]
MKPEIKYWPVIALLSMSVFRDATAEMITDPQSTYLIPLTLIITTITPFQGTTDKIEEIKRWRSVKDDAAVFVATNGAVRGVFLELALERLRLEEEYKAYDDMTLTHALLAS